MADAHKAQSHPRLTIIAIGLMLLVGAVIVFLDWDQVTQLAGKANWRFIGVALGFVAVSYVFESLSLVAMWRVFGVGLNRPYLLRVGLVSSVISNLIALPASLGLQLLVLGRRGVTQNQIIGSSLLLSYFKNLVFYAFIPLSLVYIIFSYPLVLGGVVTMVLIIVILVIAIVVSIVIVFNGRIRQFVFRVVGNIWHFITRRNIGKSLT